MLVGTTATKSEIVTSANTAQTFGSGLVPVYATPAMIALMEGAAVAQVCSDFDVPLTVVRIISDTADEQAHTSAIGFVNQYGGEYSLAILREYIQLLK